MFRSTADMMNHQYDKLVDWVGEYFFAKVGTAVIVLGTLTVFFGDAAAQLLTTSVMPEDQSVGLLAAIMAGLCVAGIVILAIFAIRELRRR